MSVPAAVFLDTSILVGQNLDFRSKGLSAFVDVMRARSLKLLLPRPVHDEIRRKLEAKCDEHKELLDKARRVAPFLRHAKFFPAERTAPPALMTAIWMSELAMFLKNFEVVELGYEGFDLSPVMLWYHRQLPPFGPKKTKEFPDAISLALIAKYADENSCTVAVVSQDGDYQEACERYPALLSFKTLGKITELLLITDDNMKRLRRSIVDDSVKLSEALLALVKTLNFSHSNHRYEIDNQAILGLYFSDIDLVAVGEGECTVSFRASMDVDYVLTWYEYDEATEEPKDYHKGWIESINITGTSKLLIGEFDEILGVSSLNIDAEEIVLQEQPSIRWG